MNWSYFEIYFIKTQSCPTSSEEVASTGKYQHNLLEAYKSVGRSSCACCVKYFMKRYGEASWTESESEELNYRDNVFFSIDPRSLVLYKVSLKVILKFFINENAVRALKEYFLLVKNIYQQFSSIFHCKFFFFVKNWKTNVRVRVWCHHDFHPSRMSRHRIEKRDGIEIQFDN